uniref:DnaJ (Hsp40) homolog, subfamily C, member 3 n=1 Tax=Schistosoma japonicum TaxID=6182 RepID=C1LGY5_SCHJA|nr:DnaJ (Hsp40) homolog, subfamily C, member 3 [Schistosoma japonicum]
MCYDVSVSFYYLFTLTCFHTIATLSINASVEDILEKGTKLLASGKFEEALSLYNDAIGMLTTFIIC